MRVSRRRRGSLLSKVWSHHPAQRTLHRQPDDRDQRTFAFNAPQSCRVFRAGPESPTLARAADSHASKLEVVPELQQRDIGGLCRLPRMRGPGSARRRGRRGRRTAGMIRAAEERIQDLFSLAETEVRRAPENLARRYVLLARRIGMRYNVRLLREYREVYCRGCSTFWVEGRSVRTRLRSGRRTQTCLHCGRVRRIRIKQRIPASSTSESVPNQGARREEMALIDEVIEMGPEPESDEGEDP